MYAIMALAPSIFFTAILSSYRGYFQGKNEMTGIAVSQVLEQILNVVVSLLFAALLFTISTPMGSAGGTVGTSVGAIFAVFYLVHIYDKKRFEEEALRLTTRERKVSSKAILRKLIRYAFPITLSAGIQNLGGVVDMMNVNLRLLHAGFTQIQSASLNGLLYKYKTLIGVPLIIVTALTTIVLPAISKAAVLKDRKSLIRNSNFAFRITFIITIPSAVGLAVLSNEIYTVLYRDTRGAYLMQLGAVILIFTALAQVQSVILQGINKFYPMILSFTIGIIFKIAANYIFVGIRYINIMGVLIGNFLCFVIPVILNHRILRRSMKARIPLIRNCVKPIISAVVMAGVILILRQPAIILGSFFSSIRIVYIIYTLIYTILLVGIGGFVYVYLMIVLGGIRRMDIESLSPKVYGMLPRFLRKKLL